MNVVVSTEPTDVGAPGVERQSSRWSTRTEWFDWIVLSATMLLALMTIWVGSSIVRGTWDFLIVSSLWGAVGMAWSVTVLLRTTDRVARFAVWALLVASLLTMFVIGSVVILIFSSWIVMGLLVVVPVVLLVRQRPIRLVWLVAPTLVAVTGALVFSSVPRSARFALAEAELSGYVQSLDQGAGSPSYDEPITVGGLPVYEVVQEEGQVLLVTGFIGILDDDPAGLAFVPVGTPVGVGWEHIRGPWFTWVPRGYVSDEPD
jgi:hypothetical protein